MSYKYGDRSICVCFKCESVRTTTMLYWDVVDVVEGDLEVGVKDILVGVCDTCDEVIFIPQQSSDAINEVLNSDEDDEDLCQKCKGPADDWHTCPSAEEINDDYETECNCCSECRQDCLYEI